MGHPDFLVEGKIFATLVPADAGCPPRLFSVAFGPARLHSALGRGSNMKRFLKIGASVAVTNLLLFWIVYGILLASWPHTGLSQSLGFSPPRISPWHPVLLSAFVVLGAPACIVLDGTEGNHFILLMALSSILNCVIWGLCIGSAIYAIGNQARRVNS
jgi:hypothetical protein